jgi:site-specific DNA-methyltransferase (cytosine-N4-specific)
MSEPAYKASQRLEAVDFDFHGTNTGYLTHGLHPYPAKYIPQIPAALIRELSNTGDAVADIFCGSGTTLVEALLAGRNAIGIDANPLACLISKAKTTVFRSGDKDTLIGLSLQAERLAADITAQTQNGGTLWDHGPFVSKAPRPEIPAIAFWFEPFVVEELAEALAWCRLLPNEETRTVGLVAFSSIVVTVSKQDSDTRYVRREKGLKPGETMQKFARALESAADAVQEFSDRASASVTCAINHCSILDRPEVAPFDLMVCSPPYPNAYSYHLYHMTRMIWLGMDQPKFKREEIGSHRKYSNKGASGATVETFREEMSAIFKWLRTTLKPAGFACFVIGDSTIRGERISNADLIADIAVATGFTECMRISRQLQATKKAFNPSIGKIKEEKILVLQS